MARAMLSIESMRTTMRVLGHSLHPMLIALPIGLLVASVIFDIIHLASGSTIWAQLAFANLGIGVLAALVAAVPGFIDWLRLPSATRAKQTGAVHMVINVIAVVLFAIDWILRFRLPSESVGAGLFVLSLIALALLSVGGWLGGELVERLGIGVWEDANVDAPSSLGAKRHAPGGFRPTEPRPA
jgi:uncharacterized membrane protein